MTDKRYLITFDDGGSGMRTRPRPLEVETPSRTAARNTSSPSLSRLRRPQHAAWAERPVASFNLGCLES